jgi:predicted nucleic acid-binding protein
VVDTSIFVDLSAGEVITEFFQLPCSFVTPVAIITELREPSSKLLMELGLQKSNLSEDHVLEATQLNQQYRGPSINDLLTLVLARTLETALLTSDRGLRKAAQQEGILTHGTLWVLDEMVQLEIISQSRAASALKLMLTKKRRLP